MADLGNLQFSVSLKDMTDADIKKIKDKLEKAGFKINASADRKSLEKNINDILKNRTFKINVEPNKKIKKAAIEVNKSVLSNSVTNALKGKTFKANVDVVIKTASVQDAIKQAFAKAGMNYNTTASDVRAQRILEIQQRMALRAAQANNNLNRSYREASSGASQFARATVGLSNGLQSNIRFGGKLGTVLGNLASILNSTNILKNVIRIGGELENQRIALGAILQDGGKATEMFSRIQSLAVKSPFGIMDLNQYTKQLSAYGIEYNELYETMKRLADISAGVGVDMGRIILAFGQVKAAGFLKGTELRQFTEANIPMVEKLAEKFSILRNEIVSAGEVYDMISDKKITFEDVKDVLWGLTDEGGMFNNMQEVLSESLASKWKNLSDAVDVMFGKIADGSVGDGLKSIASALTELTKQWDKLFTGVSTVVGLFASKSLAKSALIYSLSSVKGSTVALSRELVKIRRQANIQLGATNNIFRQFAINIKQSMSNGLAYSKAFVANFIPMMKKIGVALKSIAWSSLPFAAMTAITEGVYYFINKSEESAKRIKDVTEAASQGFENLSNKVKSIGDNMPKSTAAIKSAMQSMETALKDYAPNSDAILGDINQADKNGNYRFSDEERYKKLNQALKDTKEAYRILATEMEGFSETANKATDGVFDESFRDNIEDASDAMQVYRQSLNAISIEGVKYENAIKKAAEADADFAKAIDGKNLREILSLLKDFPDAFDAFMSEGAYVGGKIYLGFIDSIKELRKQQDIALDDANLWTEKYKGLLQSAGWDLENLTQERKIAISVDVTRFLNSIEGLDDETKKLITESVLEKQFNIKLTSNEQQVVEDKAKPEYDPSKDEVAKLWKKRAEEIDKAVAAYDKWKKVEGAGKAEQRIKGMDEFENLFNGKYGFSLSLENPTAVYEYIQSKLNKNLSAQKELIVSLGVKLSEAEFKDAQDKLKSSIEQLKTDTKKIVEGWNLYEDLFKATGNKDVSMKIAFGGNVGFKNVINHLESQIKDKMKSLGIGISFEDLVKMDSTSLEEAGFSGLTDLIDTYNKENSKLKEESVKNFLEIIKNSKDFAQQIADIDRNLQKDLSDLANGYGDTNSTDYKKRAAELIKKAEEDKVKVEFEEFKESSDWVKVFDDLDRVSDDTLDNMISKIEEFAKQAHLSEEVTKQLVEAMAKLRDEAIERNPFAGFKDAWDRINDLRKATPSGLYKIGKGTNEDPFRFLNKEQRDEALAEAYDDLNKSAMGVISKFDAVGKASSMLADLFGDTQNSFRSFADTINGAVSGAQSGANIGAVFGKSGGVYGAIAGAAIGMISAINQTHEKNIQLLIKKSESRQKKSVNISKHLETLLNRMKGGIYSLELDNETKEYFKSIVSPTGDPIRDARIMKYKGDTGKTIRKALEENSYYDAQLAHLKIQKEELEHQLRLEENRDKGKDESRIEDYKQEIRELEDSIKYFAEDMAQALYDIDFKDWASQLTDSIVNAWANGEDAAKAYENTVSDIMRNVAAKMAQQAIIEKYMNDFLKPFLDKFTAKNGVMDTEMYSELANIVDGTSDKIEQVQDFLEQLEKVMNEKGLTLRNESESSSSGLSKGIQGVTEDTANLLGSYLNSIRLDVSVKRSIIEKLAGEDIPKMSLIAQAQLTQLNNIAANTLRNAEAADRIYDLFNRVVDKGGNKLKI